MPEKKNEIKKPDYTGMGVSYMRNQYLSEEALGKLPSSVKNRIDDLARATSRRRGVAETGPDEATILNNVLLYKLSGSPEVKDIRDSKYNDLVAQDRAHYDRSENAMYVHPTSFNDYAAELAHGYNFETKNDSRFRDLKESIQYPETLTRKGYDRVMYNTPGTNEYDTHTIVQPTLKKLMKGEYNFNQADSALAADRGRVEEFLNTAAGRSWINASHKEWKEFERNKKAREKAAYKKGGTMNQIYVIPTYADDYDEYGIGGIFSSAASGAATGASVGSIIPGWGTAAGAIIGGVSGLLKGIAGNNEEKEAEAQAKKDMMLEKKNLLAQNRLQGITNSANIPTFAKGGSLSADKAKQILMDGKVHGKPLTAAQERYFGWVAGGSKAKGGKLPEGNATLKDAKDYIKAFPDEMKMGEEVEYEHTGNKKLAQRIAADHIKDFMKMTGTPGYYSALKQSGISDELNKMRLGGEIPRFGFYPTGGILPTLSNIDSYNKLSEVSGPVRRDYYPVDYVGGTSPEQLGVGRGNIGSVDLTNLTRQHADRANKPLPEGYVGTTPATQNGYDYPMNEIAMQRYGAIPNLWQVSQKGKDYNYQLDPATGKLSTPSLRQMRSASDEKFRETMTPKEHLDYRQRRKQVEDYKANGGMIETNFLTEYKTGGTHEENSLGGIPVGGKARVEQGEYRFDDPDTGESYIFSNRF